MMVRNYKLFREHLGLMKRTDTILSHARQGSRQTHRRIFRSKSAGKLETPYIRKVRATG